MAKLKAPLLSLGASGALGKAIVFFPWKGLNVAREYVVPSNPKTGPQTTQRGYLTAAVAQIHVLQADPAVPFGALDATSYALLGSIEPTPRTWFNTVVKEWVKQKVAGKWPTIAYNGFITPGSLQLTFRLRLSAEAGLITDLLIHYGTSKTALINTLAATPVEMEAGKVIPNLVAGTKYYCQARATLPVTHVGFRSGIWYGVPTA